MKIHNIRQRSAEWQALRVGIPTASDFDRIITPQGKRSGQARKYMHQLAYERIVEKPFNRDLSNVPHIQYGIVNEDRAVQAFEQQTGLKTAAVGFITNDLGTVGCSPDRCILDTREALEIKCPQGPTLCGYHIDGMADAYMAQIQGQMLIGGFRRIHFYAWSAELPPYYKLVDPDPDFIAALDRYLAEFITELAEGVALLRRLGHWPRNAPSVFPDEPDDAA